MTRPVAGWLDVGAALADLLEGDASTRATITRRRPPWLSPRAAALGAELLAVLRDDAWAVLLAEAAAPRREGIAGIADRGRTRAATTLGASTKTLARWVRGGWLLTTPEKSTSRNR